MKRKVRKEVWFTLWIISLLMLSADVNTFAGFLMWHGIWLIVFMYSYYKSEVD